MIHRYKRDAAEELRDAVQYYQNQRTELGGDFLDEVDRAIRTIKEAPKRWAKIDGDIRRYRLDRFPYQVIYAMIADAIVIIAVAHLHRRPGYWKDRID